jgi:hypothetical protein
LSILNSNLKALQAKGITQSQNDRLTTIQLNFNSSGLAIKDRTSNGLGEQFIGQELTSRRKQQLPSFKTLEFFYCFGFEDGAYIKDILKLLPKSSRLLCIEPYPEFFWNICEKVDLTDILKDNRFHIYLGSDFSTNDMSALLELSTAYESCRCLTRETPLLRACDAHHALQKKLMTAILEALKGHKARSDTSARSFKLAIQNAPVSLRCGDVNHLRSMIKGKPYISIGLGPSLATQIKDLQKVQHKAIIAVCDNALHELLDQGIDPDIVFHVEWRIESAAFYQGLKLRKPATLVYAQSVHPEILKVWPSLKAAYPSPLLDVCFLELTQGHEWPSPSGSAVGDLSTQFGVFAGAKEVYLVGMDFSCPYGSYHHPNTSAIREHYAETNRFWSPEKWDWRVTVNGDPQKVMVEGWDGAPIYTHIGIKRGVGCIDRLNHLKTKDQRIFATSKYGAKINAELASLDQLLKGPDINKDIMPSQKLISKNDLEKLLAIKHEELNRYYNKMEKLKVAAQAFTTYTESINMNHQEEYFTALNDVQSDKAIEWIERFVLYYAPNAKASAQKQKLKLLDLETDDQIIERARMFITYIDNMELYKETILSYFSYIQKDFEHE